MTVKEKVLKILDENRGVYLSGEMLAEQVGASRAAVWKAMKGLTEEGFCIDAVTNRGYMLSEDADVLSEDGIGKYLNKGLGLALDVRKSVTSTNLVMKEFVNKEEGFVIAANQQTGGLGRLGRSFSSPQDTGIYFSILLKPKLKSEELTFLTVIAAVAVCEAIEKHTGKAPAIKWVNDVFLEEKKVCGILTQASFSMENFTPEYVIVGIGINVYEPKEGFPKELKNIAGAVLKKQSGDMKNKLLAETLNRYFYHYRNFSNREFVEEYRRRSFVVGRSIYVCSGEKKTLAKALFIDDACHLAVAYEDGKEEVLSTGEISVRLAEE